MEKQQTIALSKQNEKTHWDIWKNVILLFKELKPKTTHKKAKALEQKVILEAESSLEIENLSTRISIIVEPVSKKLETIQEIENEKVVGISRSGKILRLNTYY